MFSLRRKKGLTIDPSDICYEEECEDIGFDEPGEIKGSLVQVFSFTEEPVNFAPAAAAAPEEKKSAKHTNNNNNTDVLEVKRHWTSKSNAFYDAKYFIPC